MCEIWKMQAVQHKHQENETVDWATDENLSCLPKSGTKSHGNAWDYQRRLCSWRKIIRPYGALVIPTLKVCGQIATSI